MKILFTLLTLLTFSQTLFANDPCTGTVKDKWIIELQSSENFKEVVFDIVTFGLSLSDIYEFDDSDEIWLLVDFNPSRFDSIEEANLAKKETTAYFSSQENLVFSCNTTDPHRAGGSN
jgi:hypothetical protein